MRAPRDVNVLIALLDRDHASHRIAMAWFGEHGAVGCVSRPITQNGCVRIMSHPGYPNAHSVVEVAERLRDATARGARVLARQPEPARSATGRPNARARPQAAD